MNLQGAKTMNEQFNHINTLEGIRQSFQPKNYRFIMAECLVGFFYRHTTSATEIKNQTNSILRERNILPISLGFVRNIIEK